MLVSYFIFHCCFPTLWAYKHGGSRRSLSHVHKTCHVCAPGDTFDTTEPVGTLDTGVDATTADAAAEVDITMADLAGYVPADLS